MTEVKMAENPTAGDSGASITERIEALIFNEPADSQLNATEQQTQQEQQAPEAQATDAEVETPESDALNEAEETLSVTDLAEYLGVDQTALDVDDDGSVYIKTKIDGKEGKAKFQDLVKSYQLQGHIDNEARKAAEMQKTLQERMTQFETYAKQQAEQLETMAQVAQQELLRDANSINWAELSRNDPAEYVAKQHEFQQRQSQLQQLMQTVGMQKQQAMQADAAKLEEMRTAEASRLPTLIPEWANKDVQAAEVKELIDWSLKAGITENALRLIHEARIPDSAAVVAALRKAMLYDKGKVSSVETEKKLRAAPKLVKPGQSIDARQRAQENTASLKNAIRKSGGRSGIADYLLATGKV